jgi:uncharacterized membrane protein YpjA
MMVNRFWYFLAKNIIYIYEILGAIFKGNLIEFLFEIGSKSTTLDIYIILVQIFLK